MSTPAHIVPEWYFWPFYAILRASPGFLLRTCQLMGVLAMFSRPGVVLPSLAGSLTGAFGQLSSAVPQVLLPAAA